MVIPELQRRGLFRTEYEGKTFRGNLGVPIPQNRFAKNRTSVQVPARRRPMTSCAADRATPVALEDPAALGVTRSRQAVQ